MAKKNKIKVGRSLSALSIAILLAANVQAGERSPRFNSLLQAGPSSTTWNSVIMPLLQTDKEALFFAGQYQRNRLGKNDFNWTGSLGGGYRQRMYNQYVIGGYAFIDKQHTNENHDFYLFSPGADLRTEQLSLASNFYIPIGKQRKIFSDFGDQMGIDNSIIFIPHTHTVFGQRYQISEQTMIGADVMLRYYPKHMKYLSGGLGAYHYRNTRNINQSLNNISGVKMALQFHPESYLNFSAEFRYDNKYHSRMLFGLEISLTRRTHTEDVLVDALTAQIYRHLNINTTRDGVATAISTHSVGSPILEYEDVYLVDSTANPGGDGSFATPYQTLYEALEGGNKAPDGANMWLSGEKNYESYNEPGSLQVTLHPAQSISGRSANFQLPTYGTRDNVAQVNTKQGILLSDGSALNGFYLTAISDNETNGVTLYTGHSASLQSMKVEVDSSSGSNKARGILNSGSLTMSGLGDHYFRFVSTADPADYEALGINYFDYMSIIDRQDNHISAISTDGRARGIDNELNAELVISGTGVNTISGTSENKIAWAIDNDGLLTITDSGDNNFSAKSTEGKAHVIQNNGTVTIAGSGDNNFSAESIEATARGISSILTSDFTITNAGSNTISALSALDNAWGIDNEGSLTITGSGDNNFSAESIAAQAQGIKNSGSLTISGAGDNIISAESVNDIAQGIKNSGSLTISGAGDNIISAESVGDIAQGIVNYGTFSISTTGRNTLSSTSEHGDATAILNADMFTIDGNGMAINELSASSTAGAARGIINDENDTFIISETSRNTISATSVDNQAAAILNHGIFTIEGDGITVNEFSATSTNNTARGINVDIAGASFTISTDGINTISATTEAMIAYGIDIKGDLTINGIVDNYFSAKSTMGRVENNNQGTIILENTGDNTFTAINNGSEHVYAFNQSGVSPSLTIESKGDNHFIAKTGVNPLTSGIYVSKGEVILENSGDNTISATSTEANTYGITNYASIFIENTGNNTISAKSSDGRTWSVHNEGSIIINNTTDNTFKSESESDFARGILNQKNATQFTIYNTGNNTISATSGGNHSRGIINQSQFDIHETGDNSISATSVEKAIGIKTDDTSNFQILNTGTNSITATSSTAESSGIQNKGWISINNISTQSNTTLSATAPTQLQADPFTETYTPANFNPDLICISNTVTVTCGP